MKKQRVKAAHKGAKRRYKRQPIGLRKAALARMNLGVNVSALAEELGVSRATLYYWRTREVGPGESGIGADPAYDPRDAKIRELETKVSQLEGELGRNGLEVRFFKNALRRIKETRQSREESGDIASTPKSGASRGRKAN
jgi:transposase-like protein